jgi:signal transduction histidine kinase
MPDAPVAGRKAAEGSLRHAQGMEAGDQLAAGIAHDVNNHLTAVLGALSLMERRIAQGRTDELPRCISIAGAAARHAAALTRGLLALAQRRALDPMPVDVNGLVASLDDLLRFTLGPGVSLETALAPGAWRTLCDPSQLESAVLNLAINARDAMPKGGRLAIRTGNLRLDQALALPPHGEAGPGDYVLLEIADTGMGMPPEVVERVFEPFFTTKPPGQGTGLGLPMVRAFVERWHGRFAIRSRPGCGTTMRICLPRWGMPDTRARAGTAALPGRGTALPAAGSRVPIGSPARAPGAAGRTGEPAGAPRRPAAAMARRHSAATPRAGEDRREKGAAR